MKRITLGLIPCVLVLQCVQAQNVRPILPSLDLDTLTTDVTVYFSKGNREHALRVAGVLRESTRLMQDSLGIKARVDAVLLDSAGYQSMYNHPLWPDWWPFPNLYVAFASYDNVIVMQTPAREAFVFNMYNDPMLRASGPGRDSLDAVASRLGMSADSVSVWLYDLSIAHEYGHRATQAFHGGHPGGEPPNQHFWLNEFMANYAMYAVVKAIWPERAELFRVAQMAHMEGADPPNEISIESFQEIYGDQTSPTDWVVFLQSWIRLRAARVFDELGFQFVRDVDPLIPWPRSGDPSLYQMLNALEDLWPEQTDLASWKVWLPSAGDQPAVAGRFQLDQNYPNPFNPTTAIPYSLSKASHVSLTISDMLGRRVRVLVEGMQPPGSYVATFAAGDLPSGVYLYRMEVGDFVETRAMMLAR